MPDIEKSVRLLRGEAGSLRLSQIVEKVFFIESRKSHILQLCDLCAYAIRRSEEQKNRLCRETRRAVHHPVG